MNNEASLASAPEGIADIGRPFGRRGAWFSLHRIGLIGICLVTGCGQGSGSRIAHFRAGGSYSGGGPSVSADGTYILFSSPRTGNGDIYRVNIDGSNVQRLTADANCECDAQCSPDGKSIAFIREQHGIGNVWMMNSDGTGRKPLTDSRGDQGGPQFSPDGSQIVLWRTDPTLESRVGSSRAREIFLIDVNSGLETRLTDNRFEDVFPAFAPDGKSIGFVRDDRTWIMDRDGANAKVVGSGYQPTFSPDGQQIVSMGGQYGRQIDVMNVDGSGRRTIYSKNTRVSHPVYSRDGLAVLFLEEVSPGGVGNIILLRLDGAGAKTIAQTW